MREASCNADTMRKVRLKTKKVGIGFVKTVFKYLAILLMGFTGGVFAPLFLSRSVGAQVTEVADAFSIANTYIIFTTLFFVGVTVIMAALGYVITQQLALSKAEHERQALHDIGVKLSKDEEVGIELINQLLTNPDVLRHIEAQMGNKVEQAVRERRVAAEQKSDRLARQAGEAQQEVEQLNGFFNS